MIPGRRDRALYRLATAALMACLVAPTAWADADVAAPPGARDEARALVKTFAGRLQAALKGAIEAQGFEHAIGVCQIEAPKIAGALGAESAWQVGRTALRLRNPNNAPTPAERAVLADFEARARAGESLAAMEHEAVVDEDGVSRYRYMKAIPVGEVCTACHGAAIDPGLAATIRTRYPQDRATGFELGQLRGAFTLSKPLP